MSRDADLALVREYTKNENLVRHMLAVEAAVRAYARKFGEDEEKWGSVGLLHDFDYERWPDPPDHPLKGSAILNERGYPGRRDLRHQVARRLSDRLPPRLALGQDAVRVRRAVRLHHGLRTGAADTSGGLDAKSVRKKMKQASFAAAVKREDITSGAADLGVDLDEHINFCIRAMQSIAPELGLVAA